MKEEQKATSFWKAIDKEFWLGQFFMIVATVLGVYLAANSGFQKALEFENLQKSKEAYLLERALVDEVAQNFEYMQEWFVLYEKDPGRNELNYSPDAHSIDDLIFSTIAENDATTGIAYDELKDISSFYRFAQPVLADMKKGNPFDFNFVKKDYDALFTVTTDTLKRLYASLDAQKKKLEREGVI